MSANVRSEVATEINKVLEKANNEEPTWNEQKGLKQFKQIEFLFAY